MCGVKRIGFWRELKKNRRLNSYFVIVFAVVFVLVLHSLVVLTQIRKDADENNLNLTTYYNALTEAMLQSIEDNSLTLIYCDAAKRMSTIQEVNIYSPEMLSTAYDLVSDIRNFVLTSEILEDMYVYYPETDLCIGRKGAFASYVYFKSEQQTALPLEEEYSRWKSRFENKQSGFYTRVNESGQHSVYYFLKMLSSNANSQRIVVAEIGVSQLNASFNRMMAGSPCAYTTLVDDDGNTYASVGEEGNFLNEAGQFDFWESSGRYIVCHTTSQYWPLTYVTVQDFNAVYQNVYRLILITVLGVFAALLLGSALAMFFMNRNRIAVKQLVNRFPETQQSHMQESFDYIGAQIDKLIDSNASAIEAAEQQQKLIQSFFLRELLHNTARTKQEVERIYATYQISMENALYSLIVLSPASPLTDSEENAIRSVVAAHAGSSFAVYQTALDGREVFLCNFDATTRLPQAPVIALAKELHALVKSEIEISSLTEEIMPQIAFYTEHYGVQQKEKKPVPAQQNQTESQLLLEFGMAIDQDDLSTAVLLIPRLQQWVLETENENLRACRRYALLSKLYDAYDSPKMLRELDALASHINGAEWGTQLGTMLQRLDRDINRREVDTRQVADIVKETILREYSNPQLGLQTIADQIGISQSYLSRLFKEKYGVSVIHYLNQIRIERAKELMRETDDNLNVIAIRCGFTSNINLIRVFKKYERVTPGTFRNQEETSQ